MAIGMTSQNLGLAANGLREGFKAIFEQKRLTKNQHSFVLFSFSTDRAIKNHFRFYFYKALLLLMFVVKLFLVTEATVASSRLVGLPYVCIF